MTATSVENPASPVAEVATVAPIPLPDYLLSPDAVLNDEATWRFGKAPDYSNTRRAFAESKKMNHSAGSLEDLVQNLVKNWEIEASFKTRLSDWRTIDPMSYTFAINGGPPQDAEHMLGVGTYNAIIAPNSFYSPEHSDFSQSHKTFKRMMPTFAWEVLEVYSGTPRVAFKWRHWGQMKSDYAGFNDKGERITATAHGGLLDIQGVTVALLNDNFKVTSLETWFDPLEMFRQFTPRKASNDTPVNGEASTNLEEGKEKQVFQTELKEDTSESIFPIEEATVSHPRVEDQTGREETSVIDGLPTTVEPERAPSSQPTGILNEYEASESVAIGPSSELDLSPEHPEMPTDLGDSASCPFLLAQMNINAPAASEIPVTKSEIDENVTTASVSVQAPELEQGAEPLVALPACDPNGKSLMPIMPSGCCADKPEKETAAADAVTPLAADTILFATPEGHTEYVAPAPIADHLSFHHPSSPNQPEAHMEVVEPKIITTPVDTNVVPAFQQSESQEKAMETTIKVDSSSPDLRNGTETEAGPEASAAHHLIQDQSVVEYGHKDSDPTAESKQEPCADAPAETPAPALLNSEPTRSAPE